MSFFDNEDSDQNLKIKTPTELLSDYIVQILYPNYDDFVNSKEKDKEQTLQNVEQIINKTLPKIEKALDVKISSINAAFKWQDYAESNEDKYPKDFKNNTNFKVVYHQIFDEIFIMQPDTRDVEELIKEVFDKFVDQCKLINLDLQSKEPIATNILLSLLDSVSDCKINDNDLYICKDIADIEESSCFMINIDYLGVEAGGSKLQNNAFNTYSEDDVLFVKTILGEFDVFNVDDGVCVVIIKNIIANNMVFDTKEDIKMNILNAYLAFDEKNQSALIPLNFR